MIFWVRDLTGKKNGPSLIFKMGLWLLKRVGSITSVGLQWEHSSFSSIKRVNVDAVDSITLPGVRGIIGGVRTWCSLCIWKGEEKNLSFG